MLGIALIDAIFALVFIAWIRKATRLRGDEIPCTSGIFSFAVVWVGVGPLIGIVVVNVLALVAIDRSFGRQVSPALFTGWLLTMSAAAITFIVAVTAHHTNRTAEAWLRLVAPDVVSIRVGDDVVTLRLTPGSVRLGACVISSGVVYAMYFLRSDERAVVLTVLHSRKGPRIQAGTPMGTVPEGLVVQGRPREVERFLLPFCEPDRAAGVDTTRA